MTRGLESADEFETIARLFRPLAEHEAALSLMDDAACLSPASGHDLVMTMDTIVEGVHFLPDDPLDLVARKLLRVNLSDLAAKGAVPFGYLLSTAWRESSGWSEREAFSAGLREDQSRYGLTLLGGDTVVTPGPYVFSATLIGMVRSGRMVRRSGARPGDLVLVTDTIGDGYLGLKVAQQTLSLEPEREAALLDRYRIPEPRCDFIEPLQAHANAAVDVSDGLLADLAHICKASAVGMDIDLFRMPMSRAVLSWFENRVDPVDAALMLATGGDDYQVAFTAHPGALSALEAEAKDRHLRLTVLGEVTEAEGLQVRYGETHLTPSRLGWRHGED